MYGAILGDIIGSPYEFDRGQKTKIFPLFGPTSHYTDDTVMTIAVAQAFLEAQDGETEENLRERLTGCMCFWGRRYPHAGYGVKFSSWLQEQKPKPYNSYGNGSAMRVSGVAWLFDSLEEVLWAARLSAEVSHNHPEGIKGAQATAAVIFLARSGCSKAQIRAYVQEQFYDLSRNCNQIRPTYHHVESCQETVPEAITAFLEGEDFEDVIRTAVSLGGDCDTLTAIAGSMAEGYYGVPENLITRCRDRLPADLLAVLEQFDQRRLPRVRAGR